MKNFQFIKNHLVKNKIPFEEITFTDKEVKGRILDTSTDHNYDPKNAIKTLVVKSKNGYFGVVLKAKDKIDTVKFTNLIGNWSIINEKKLLTKFQMIKGGICPLVLNIPLFIDRKILNLKMLSMGAGDLHKGLNIQLKILLNKTKNQIADLSISKTKKSAILINKSMDAIDILLTRGVDKIYPSKEALEKVLRSGKKLRLYQGFDPTGTQLHIGHAVGFRKLRQFQDLGHQVIFLIGDGTGLAGDPSGKMKARGRFMSRSELRDNAKAYLMQAAKIVRFEGESPIEIKYNGDWLTKLQLEDLLNIAQHFSLQQMIERDMYQERMKIGDTINLREFLYPLLQGYDSVAMKVDLELGGSDQTFNMLAGRTLVKAMLGKEKFVMTVPLLADSRGVKIGKTEGNVIGLTDPPNDFYAKIMSLSDDAIIPCFTLLTDMSQAEIERMKQELVQGANPMLFKKKLAFDLTKQLNSQIEAEKAQTYFEEVFQKHQMSQDLDNYMTNQLPTNPINVIDLLIITGLIKSKSEARRLVEQKAIEIDQTIVDMINTNVTVKPDMVLRVGKKKFLRFI